MQPLSEQPLVSVVIATFNMSQYLPAAVNSILAGTYKNVEVIIIDDGSTDDTGRIIENSVDDDRVRYIRQQNLGQPKAKNHGLREATGEFIAFCDADDLWEPNKLELQLPLFADASVGVVYSEISNIDQHQQPLPQPEPQDRHRGTVTNELLIKNFVPFGTAVIRRECVERSGYFDEQFRMGIDWDLWLRYSLDWQFDYVEDRTYIYRVWDGQMSTNYRGRYEHAFAILANFETNHGEKVAKHVMRSAWADNYISKARTYVHHEGRSIYSLRLLAKGIFLEPLSLKGWKCLFRILVGRR
ncbi:MAG: glycosyltransferase family 2 protein [Pseudomonadales bacterium]|nr:MAG: glycosyltransferase family 2 protein [Pseudomonadales bacterium]